MNQSKPTICCEKCLEKIGRVNTNAARFWMNLCDVPDDKPLIADQNYRVIEVLEHLGFLLSTDIAEERIQLRILGKEYHYEGDFFLVCGGKCRAC